MKKNFIISLLVCSCLFACNVSSNKSQSSSKSNDIEYSESDYVVTYYVISNPVKFATGGEYDTNDLKESGSLLFSRNGIVKAIEFANGWTKVNHFTKRTAVPGLWWRYMIYYDGFSEEAEIDVYLPMN